MLECPDSGTGLPRHLQGQQPCRSTQDACSNLLTQLGELAPQGMGCESRPAVPCAGTLQRHDSDSYSQLLRNPSGSLCLSSSEPSLGTKRSASLLWDSAQAEAFTSAIQAALQERRSSGSNCQADFWPGT